MSGLVIKKPPIQLLAKSRLYFVKIDTAMPENRLEGVSASWLGSVKRRELLQVFQGPLPTKRETQGI